MQEHSETIYVVLSAHACGVERLCGGVALRVQPNKATAWHRTTSFLL